MKHESVFSLTRFITFFIALTSVAAFHPNPAWGSEGEILVSSREGQAIAPRLNSTPRPVRVTSENHVAAPFSLSLVGTLSSPQVAGQTLEAADLFLSEGKAFVAYNLAGGPTVGGIDVLALHSQSPKLDHELIINHSGINAVAFDPTTDKLYFVGEAALNDATAFLGVMKLTCGLSLFPAKTYPLPSYAGTHVAVGKHTVYATSGVKGGLTVFRKQWNGLKPMAYAPIADARAVGFTPSEDNVIVASGRPAAITLFNSSGPHPYVLGGATAPDSKSTIQVGNLTSLVSAGDAGADVVCNENGTILANIPQVTVAGMQTSDTVTNSATECGGIIFTANGGAGVYAYQKTEVANRSTSCPKVTITKLGSLNFDENFVSANHVVCLNHTLLVASGRGGTKIVNVDFTH
jgi:hypothetical protein